VIVRGPNTRSGPSTASPIRRMDLESGAHPLHGRLARAVAAPDDHQPCSTTPFALDCARSGRSPMSTMRRANRLAQGRTAGRSGSRLAGPPPPPEPHGGRRSQGRTTVRRCRRCDGQLRSTRVARMAERRTRVPTSASTPALQIPAAGQCPGAQPQSRLPRPPPQR